MTGNGVWIAEVFGAFVVGALFGLLLAAELGRWRAYRDGRGGMLDLTPAAVQGHLDLDWGDPRDTPDRPPLQLVSDG